MIDQYGSTVKLSRFPSQLADWERISDPDALTLENLYLGPFCCSHVLELLK